MSNPRNHMMKSSSPCPSGIILAAVIWLGMSSFGKAEKPFEDFSTWANGVDDSNNNKFADIADDGGSSNDWTPHHSYSIQTTPEGKVLALGAGRGRPLAWNQIGKAHDINLSGEKAVELTMRVANPREQGASLVSAWLADGERNGYGMAFGGLFPMKNRVGVRIFKFRDNALPFESLKLPKFSSENGEPSGDQLKSLSELVPAGQVVDFHLRIEQLNPNGPVVLTLWNTGCPDVPDTSYEDPLLQLEDDGKGGVFHTADNSFGPVFNLGSLTHVGLASAQFLKKDQTPEEQAAEPSIFFKEISIRPVRP